jgi:DNA mismatch endonuclease (patch repair protein)
VFVDGEYFHGKNWEIQKFRIKTYREFWWDKIERNIERDKLVNQHLAKSGWKVLRFWTEDVQKNCDFYPLKMT